MEFAPSAQAENGWNFALFAWRRRWMVVFGVVVALGLGYLYFLRQTPIFQSSAEILLVHNRAALPIQGVQTDRRSGDTHRKLLRSPIIVERAVRNHDLASLPSLQQSSDPVETVISGLVVMEPTKRFDDLIAFTYQSPFRADCPKILEAIIAAYEDFFDETYRNVNLETANLITRAKDELDRQITELEEDYRKFRYEAPLLFGGGSGENGQPSQNIHESRLASIEEVRSRAVLENSKLQAEIEAIENAVARGSDREALNLMIGNMTRFGFSSEQSAEGQLVPTGRSVEEQLFPMMLEEQMLLENYGPDHPEVKAIRHRIEMSRELLLGTRTISNDAGGPKDFHQVYLDSLREQIKMNEQTVAKMTELFETEREQSRALAGYQASDETYRSSIQRKERLFDAVVGRLEEISLMQDASGMRTQVSHPPSQARQIAPNLYRILISSVFLGLLSGLGLAYTVDAADRRFRSPDDIREYLGLPIIGHIPAIPVLKEATTDSSTANGIAADVDQILRSVHRPRGRIAEAYRAVRTALYFSARGKGHQVVQVTSPSPGDGKSTLAANLSVSIAKSGKDVLLIDADFRRPRQHKLFGLDNSVGFASVIQGTAELVDAIRETSVEKLSILSCGPRPDNPSELLTSREFEEFVDVVRDRYELVVVDTPPLLAVTDPSAVAARVDSVLLTMRLLKNARSLAGRALEVLDSLGVNVLGIVVNGVGGDSGYGYGYGRGYGYGYGRGYAYGYGDGVGCADNKYYSDDEEQTDESIAAEANIR